MKKSLKVLCILCALLVIITMGSLLYVGIGLKRVEHKMWDYLNQENYSETDIHSIKVSHSFLSKLLSYNEWNIEVVYEDDPASLYSYTLRDGEIVESGRSGAINDFKH